MEPQATAHPEPYTWDDFVALPDHDRRELEKLERLVMDAGGFHHLAEELAHAASFAPPSFPELVIGLGELWAYDEAVG